MIKKFLEFKEDNFEPIKSFYLHDELSTDVWTDFVIDENIREELVKIGKDFFDSLELKVDIKDIILTGSLCNYNYSKYSDFDVHIIIDYNEVNDDTEIVEKYLGYAKKIWVMEHNILIKNYDVEVYCQNIHEVHIANGQFSLLNDKWIKKPSKENFKPDEQLIREKAEIIMEIIDDIEKMFNSGKTYDELLPKIKVIWKKIKDNRKAGLEKDGELSTENLVFKLLRRNGYIEKLLDIKVKSYDQQFN